MDPFDDDDLMDEDEHPVSPGGPLDLPDSSSHSDQSSEPISSSDGPHSDVDPWAHWSPDLNNPYVSFSDEDGSPSTNVPSALVCVPAVHNAAREVVTGVGTENNFGLPPASEISDDYVDELVDTMAAKLVKVAFLRLLRNGPAFGIFPPPVTTSSVIY